MIKTQTPEVLASLRARFVRAAIVSSAARSLRGAGCATSRRGVARPARLREVAHPAPRSDLAALDRIAGADEPSSEAREYLRGLRLDHRVGPADLAHERELLALSEQCHPQTLRQIRWANTMIKTQTPQVLAP